MRAYDVAVLPRNADRTAPANHGWIFGLPPGIAPAQWPLDPVTGHPLVHGFTVLLPDAYRVHGPEIVALSFFATAADQNDGGAMPDPGLAQAVLAQEATPPDDPALRPYWEAGRRGHPHLHRMTDILDYAYAVILLTRDEFDGPLCPPPAPLPALGPKPAPPPGWLAIGAAAAYFEGAVSLPLSIALEEHFVFRVFGEVPARDLAYHRALSWSPRAADPNAGKSPRETWEPGPDGYQPPHYWLDGKIDVAHYREHDWAKGHGPNHIGGTMRPIQAIPEFSPYYIAFEEYFGGYNFGGGNAQLDFKDMKFDWACG